MPLYTLTPQDVLFFRDGRPIEATGGHGARWPEPSLVFDALHAALHRAFPALEAQPWEHSHRFGRASDRDPARDRTQRFGSLATAGLFPVLKNGEWLFPSPKDAMPSDGPELEILRPLKDQQGERNLPNPLRYPLANPCEPSKDEAEPWWTRAAFDAYLSGKKPEDGMLKTDSDLFAGEWTTGIGIDPERQTQDGERIYSAEYMRLHPGVSLGFSATLPVKQNGDDVRECIGELFTATRSLIVGGQQRICTVEPLNHGQTLASVLPRGGKVTGTRVKWVLLTPAVFPAITADPARGIQGHDGGWLPNWIEESENGGVLLRAGDTRRGQRESREAWRARVRSLPAIGARLVAARIPKPVVITGWTERLHLLRHKNSPDGEELKRGPRPTLLAVPAGAVYYFEADSAEDAANLAAALNWHGADQNPTTIENRRSTLMGEKGFGLGVCGVWEFYEDVAGRPGQ